MLHAHLANLASRYGTGRSRRSVPLMATPLLILFTESLDVRFAVRIEEFLAALLPRRFEFGCCDVPVRPTFFGNGAQILAEIFHGGPTEEPVAVVDHINDKTGLEHNHVGDYGIVEWISVFGDVEIFLDDTPRVREERPVGTDSAAIFIRLSDIVGTDRDEPAIGNLELTMKFNKPFSLPAILGAETSAAEDENHWMLSLQFGELPAFRGVVGKLIVGEDSPWNNVRSHVKSSTVGCALPSYVSMVSCQRSQSGLSQRAAPNPQREEPTKPRPPRPVSSEPYFQQPKLLRLILVAPPYL